MQPESTTVEALLGQPRRELEQLCEQFGEPAYRGRQLARWLYQAGARDFAAMTSLPVALRELLAERWCPGRSDVAAVQRSTDGTLKLLLALADGERIETVVLPYADRLSTCVSSQTGCAVGCTFCATGYLGAGRNLTAGELTDQLLTAAEQAGRRVSHVVFMGMGEPLLNLAAVVAAVHLWRDELELSPRRVTVSTVGLPDAIRELAAADLGVTLAVSLHAGDDELRARLIPSTARRWSVAQVLEAARCFGRQTGRRVSYEVVLLQEVNDRPADAAALVGRLRRGEHVNLIPFNPVGEAPFRRPGPERVARFRHRLESAGLVVTQRQERGTDIDGACGQLRARSDAV